VTRDQPSGGARCVPASEPSRLLSRPVHSLHRQAERATVPGDAFESSPSYVRFLGPELRRWHGARGAGARTSRRPRWKRCSEHGHPAITEPNAGAARRNRRAESARSYELDALGSHRLVTGPVKERATERQASGTAIFSPRGVGVRRRPRRVAVGKGGRVSPSPSCSRCSASPPRRRTWVRDRSYEHGRPRYPPGSRTLERFSF
jgi:hypothetical protein